MSVDSTRVMGGPGAAPKVRPRSAFRTKARRLRDPAVVVGAVVLTVVIAAALVPGTLAPHDPLTQNLSARLMPPASTTPEGNRHWLGTDGLGRDILSRVIYGARISGVIAVLAVAVRGVVGVWLGLLSGYYGGLTDTIFMRLADIQLALPFLLLAIAVATVTTPSLLTVVAVLGMTGWMAYARLVRAQVLSLREKEFVDAARALGIPTTRILLRHILPNVFASVIALMTIDVPAMILAESSLSFLGIGVPLSTPSWGGMVALGRNHLVTAWWVPVMPGLAIAVVVLGLSLIGDWVRDELDPTLRHR